MKWHALLRYTEVRFFHAGEMVVKQGDQDRTIFIVAEGELEVLIPQGRHGKLQTLVRVATGTVTGEQAFLDGLPRSANLRAISDGKLITLSLTAFEIFSAEHPHLARELLLDLARVLSAKLRHANQFIASHIK